ncbi:MAG: RNA polymerase sigma factor RpoD/SigA [Acidimicrobiia bacterium]
MGQDDQSDLLDRYLYEIRAIPLLSKEEEEELGRGIARGRVAERALTERSPADSTTDIGDLEERVRIGRAAAEHLFRANLPLVVYVAKRYRRVGAELLDVIQDGNIGLVRAVEKFDHRRGVRFSTFGVWWIRQAIRTGPTSNTGVIQLPLRFRDRLALVHAVESRLTVELGRAPTQPELATELGLTRQEVERVRTTAVQVRSLAEHAAEDEPGLTLADRLADPRPGPEAVAAAADDLARLLGHLSERERRIVAMRYGLHGYRPLTLKEVGDAMGLTGERVRQLEARAIETLRHVASS